MKKAENHQNHPRRSWALNHMGNVSYSERVSATLQLLGFDVEAEEFSENLGLKPTFVRKGVWCYETKPFVSSRNVNEHLRYLLRLFLPVKSKIEDLRPNVTVTVCIHWETNMTAGGGGPIVDNECILGLAQLEASVSFEVFQTNVASNS
jgi:hypothetical protein